MTSTVTTTAMQDDIKSIPTIAVITLERGGFGQASSTLLTLQRDGSASYRVTGNARMGQANQAHAASLPRADFEALARLVVAQRFFALEDQYADPQIADGAWLSIGVQRQGQLKSVFSRDGAGPAALKAVEAAIEGLRQRLQFVAVPP